MTYTGHEMIVQRGETFTLDKVIVNRDNSPFIVSKEYKNPYILISVASGKYNQENRYIANWWLDLDKLYTNDGEIKLPRFLYTRPKLIESFDITSVVNEGPTDYLYYTNDISKCKYFDEYNVWHDYEFRIIHHFLHSVTKDWVEQTYYYSIRLVAGLDMETYIRDLYIAVFYKAPDDRKSVEELYLEIKNKDETFVKDLVITRPLATFEVVQDILLPTKITVLSDLNGGLK